MPVRRQRGKYRHRVTIQTTAETQDSGGGVLLGTPVEAGKRWAAFRSIRGRERQELGFEKAEQVGEWRFDFFSGLTTDHQIAFNVNTWNVTAIDNVGEENIEHRVMAVYQLKDV